MVFFLVLYLETSFLAYMCILGQLKKKFFFFEKKNFLAAILKKIGQISARARVEGRDAFKMRLRESGRM